MKVLCKVMVKCQFSYLYPHRRNFKVKIRYVRATLFGINYKICSFVLIATSNLLPSFSNVINEQTRLHEKISNCQLSINK